MKNSFPDDLIDIVEVKVFEEYKLYLRFENGVCGEVDIAELVSFEGIFAPLKNREYFSNVFVNSDLGTICWKNGADLAPSFLYKHLTSMQKQ